MKAGWAIIAATLKARRWSIAWWCFGVAAFISLELGVYSSIKSQAAQLNQALSHLSPAAKSLFGANSDLFSPIGYLNSRLYYLLLPLLLSILAIGLGSSLLAREESDGTIELLLARPISRAKLLTAKAISGLTIIGTVSGVALASILVWIKIVKLDVSLTNAAIAALLTVLLATMFGALAFALAGTGRLGRTAAIGLSSLIGLGGYIVGSLEAQVHWLRWPARFLPYHYYNPLAILGGGRPWPAAAAFVLITLLLGLVAWLSFHQRDLG